MSDRPSDRVKALGISLGGVVVMGSGIMGELGIRESDDIDLMLEERVFEGLANHEGWRSIERDGREIFVHDEYKVEAWRSWVAPGGSLVDFAAILPQTVVIHDVRFATLEYVREWKQWYNRDKDIADVALIDEYVELNR
ncbi:hypothetical protein B7Y94_00095 [Candidatus Saccharibacteria bacterium 32-49-12]|nr:MAG: hypothetical protein B7Y94_00095 [Candidatus Saccharibacteria bacterium 32-49-12]